MDFESLPPHVWVQLHDRAQIRRKLRISLTEHCNLACFFCHNEGQGPIRKRAGANLSLGEMRTIIRIALLEGVDRIKLTGGEPLLFRSGDDDIVSLVRELTRLRDEERSFDLSMTTNGSLLPEYAQRLATVGLDRATVSLTTLDERTFEDLISPNRALLARSLAGLRAARQAGLTPLKINAVLYHSDRRGVGNLAEVKRLVDIAAQHSVDELRFFTLLWHDNFSAFGEFYHFFSPEMRDTLRALLDHCGVVDPSGTVAVLSDLASTFAHRLYPKVEFGVEAGPVRLAFEAMKYDRLANGSGLQEGPYAMRVGSNGALRATLYGPSSHDLIRGVREGRTDRELRSRYRTALKEMP